MEVRAPLNKKITLPLIGRPVINAVLKVAKVVDKQLQPQS